MVAAASVGALMLAQGASAAYKPHFTATSTDDGIATLDYTQTASNDGPAVLAVYAPAAYARLAAMPGKTIGEATAHAVGADLGGSTVLLRGNIRVATASTPLGNGVTAGQQRKSCTGSDTSAALWIATLRGYLQTIKLGIAVQHVTSGPLAGGAALFVCPPPADVASGIAGRAPLGLKIVQLSFEFSIAIDVAPGIYTWHLRATPYISGSAVPNAAGAVEAEASHGTPQTITLIATPAPPSRRVPVSGRLTRAGAGVAGRTVRILAGGKLIGTAKTDGSGGFSTTALLRSAKATLLARAVVPAKYFDTCGTPVFPSIPCTSSILEGFTATSGPVRVKL
jgi:hypothetical protein